MGYPSFSLSSSGTIVTPQRLPMLRFAHLIHTSQHLVTGCDDHMEVECLRSMVCNEWVRCMDLESNIVVGKDSGRLKSCEGCEKEFWCEGWEK